jgi:hypothetical protein
MFYLTLFAFYFGFIFTVLLQFALFWRLLAFLTALFDLRERFLVNSATIF